MSTSHDISNIGSVSIADDVVASIAGLATLEVEGVSKLNGNISNELVSKLGKKNLSKGVKVIIEENNVIVDLSIEIKYGYNVRNVSESIQKKVKQSIENMTGLNTYMVNVSVSGVMIED